MPRSQVTGNPFTASNEEQETRACAWGAGDVRHAKAEVRQTNSESGGLPTIPWARLATLTASGPSCERQEHLDAIINGAGQSQRRRLTRALDVLTVRWATNRLSHACWWMLNTQALVLRKEKERTCKEFDDE